MKWIISNDGLPGMNKAVQWRNAQGGNIPLGTCTFLEMYNKAGANTLWFEWLDESDESPAPTPQETEATPLQIQSIKRGMAEYFMQHNYRELYGMFENIILPILESSVSPVTIKTEKTGEEDDKDAAQWLNNEKYQPQINLWAEVAKEFHFDKPFHDAVVKAISQRLIDKGFIISKEPMGDDAVRFTEAQMYDCALKFFYHWYNAKGSNTAKGLQEWLPGYLQSLK